MLCGGRAPFEGRSDDGSVASVRRGKYTLSSRYWDGLSELAKNFVRQCLQYYPSRRPSAATPVPYTHLRAHETGRQLG